MKKTVYVSLLLLTLLLCLSGCGTDKKMKDGFYTAEMSDFSHGWKEYLCIMVKNDKIVYAEFNAKDPSGYIKAWDNAYMKNMAPIAGTYPNEYTREYVAQLIETQDPKEVETVTGASSSGSNFSKLSAAVVEQAKEGNPEVKIVETEKEE